VAVRLLLKNGASVDTKDNNRLTLLHYAAKVGYEAVVRLLLDKEANVNGQGGYYSNALQAASAKGHDQIMSTGC
jgi:ankyrin repeat protein